MKKFNMEKFEQALQNGEFKYLELLRAGDYLNVFRLKVKCNAGGYGLEINRSSLSLHAHWFYYFTPLGGYQLINPIDLPRYTIGFEELLENLSSSPEVQQELLFHLDLFRSS